MLIFKYDYDKILKMNERGNKMKHYLGIDGGGTKTKLCLINEKKEVIGFYSAGPSSIDTVSEEITRNNILFPYKELLKIAPKNSEVSAVFAGIGGIINEEDEQLVKNLLRKLPNLAKNAKINAKNDMYNALYCGLLFDEGMTLIIGTGSVAFGKDSHGNSHKCGGWGYKEGDAGSAYNLGKEALQLAIRATDGRISRTPFTQELCETIGLESIYDIVPVVNSLWEDRTKVASYAKIVTKYAEKNDKNAIQIIDIAIEQIVLAVNGVLRNLDITNKTLVIVGGLGNSEGYFKEKLHQRIKNLDKDIIITSPKVDPAEGAALMAINL
jgi:N-acetylglucosamine kinase-like BadF-type ATPase